MVLIHGYACELWGDYHLSEAEQLADSHMKILNGKLEIIIIFVLVHVSQLQWNLGSFVFDAVMIQEDYHSQNPYHNAVHAADVTQAMHCYLKEPKVRCWHFQWVKILRKLPLA